MHLKRDPYFILNISNIEPAAIDILTHIVFDHSALGTEEILPFTQSGRFYEPETIEAEVTAIKAYFESTPTQALVQDIMAKWPSAKLEISHEESKDWLAEWKASFKPFQLVDGIWVVPSWCEPPPGIVSSIRIDPGMAFGTGTHETTQLAAQFLSQLKPLSGSIFDVGTGTGMLAILAEKLGAENVLANDIDPEAVRVARENVVKNNSRVKVTDLDIAFVQSSFDLVVANIIDGVLVRLQSELKRLTAQNGYLILTGILFERQHVFLSEFSFKGFTVIDHAVKGEWVGFLLKKTELTGRGN